MSIDAVLFDVDDILIDHRSAVRKGFLAHVARVAPDIDAQVAYPQWHALEQRHYARYLSGELTWQGQRRECVRELAIALERVSDVERGWGLMIGSCHVERF